MAKSKFNFNDLHIGQNIKTVHGETGEIVSLMSYSYINDKIQRESINRDGIILDLKPFKMDDVKHRGVWYCAVTIAVLDPKFPTPAYYLVGIDINEIEEIIQENVPEKQPTFLDKLKSFFRH